MITDQLTWYEHGAFCCKHQIRMHDARRYQGNVSYGIFKGSIKYVW